MKALVLINLCAREYQDVGFERIARDPSTVTVVNGANWLDYLNDAQRTLVLVRPDANASIEAAALVAGTKQALPTGATRLLGVTRNMGANGTTVGRVVQMSDRATQDQINLDWHTATAASPVREVYYDDKKTSLNYFVSPPAVSPWYLELEVSRPPTDVADAATDDITLSDVYAGPLQAWMLFRAYALATQALGQFQKAQFQLSHFFNLLGVKMRNDILLSANVGGAFVPSPTNLQGSPNAG